ncbi:hypothetical protein ONV78_00825 [Hahella sp. CR1]|uniref:DUF6843 domain-containing protein n=1 Tax=Hahella sp. CR1 TaxID=2992807 RepID=UPI0024415CCC|nr:hypothetical protein [Hahella sp. CR1]MDG9666255.1 hypothetical protein [Hahella sp. CR1]
MTPTTAKRRLAFSPLKTTTFSKILHVTQYRYPKLMNKLPLCLLLTAMSLIAACGEKAAPPEPEIYLLPDKFVGKFYILFNTPAGEPVRHEKESRVYEIPPSGVLLSQGKLNEGWIAAEDVKYYYVGEDGQRVEIKGRWTTSLDDTPENRNDPELTIFGGGAGVYSDPSIPCSVTYQSYYVGLKADVLEGKNQFGLEEYLDKHPFQCP